MASTPVGSLRGFAGAFVPHLIAVCVWAVVGSQWAPVTAGPLTPQKWILSVGLLTAYFVVLAAVRLCYPFRVSRSNPARLVGGGKSYTVYTFTGRSNNVTKIPVTTVRGSMQMGGMIYDGTGSIYGSGKISSSTEMFDRFFLADAQGHTEGYTVRGVDLSIGNDQVISSAVAVRPGHKRGSYLLFWNHTTDQVTYPDAALTRIVLVGRHLVWWVTITALCLALGGRPEVLIIYVPLLLVLHMVAGLRKSAFRNSGAAPLLESLRAGARELEQTAPAGAAGPQAVEAPPIVPPPPPPPPPAFQPAGSPPAWLADPSARHELRYWDGGRWTEHVSDVGAQALDPLG